jgi:hypothetical protein
LAGYVAAWDVSEILCFLGHEKMNGRETCSQLNRGDYLGGVEID